jgi:hypothetical protein
LTDLDWNHYKNRQQAGAADGMPPLTLTLGGKIMFWFFFEMFMRRCY